MPKKLAQKIVKEPSTAKSEVVNPLQFLGIALQIGFTVTSITLLSIYAGWWLDEKYGTSPLGILVGAALGFGLAMWTTWQILRPLREQLKKFK